MYKAIILPLAKKDIREAAFWYEGKQTGLGKRFAKQIRENITLIKKNPKVFNNRFDNVRTAVLKAFPFMLHYTIDEYNKQVIVIAVLHTSRNPERWKDR